MTDNEIIQALECCIEPTSNCKCCPLHVGGDGDCVDKSKEGALNLIKRQQAEIERLRNQLKLLKAKKPTHEASLYRSFTCPSCKNVVDESTTLNGKKCRILVDHCKYCGQKLDWEGVFADE
jgi:hypothetical protein